MTTRIRKNLWVAAALAAAITLGTSAPARAALELVLSEDGGPSQTVVAGDQGPANFDGTLGDFTIHLSVGTSNSPGTGALAFTTKSTSTITNNSGDTHTLHINVSAQNFTSPNSPPATSLVDSVGGALISGGLTGSLQGFADANNALFGQTTKATLLPFSVTDTGGVSGTGTPVAFSPNGATYSLTVLETFTFTGGSIFSGSVGNVDVRPTPEPATMVSALVGLGLFGGAGWLRRRKRQA